MEEKVAFAASGAWVGTTAACIICSIITFLAARLPNGLGVGSMVALAAAAADTDFFDPAAAFLSAGVVVTLFDEAVEGVLGVSFVTPEVEAVLAAGLTALPTASAALLLTGAALATAGFFAGAAVLATVFTAALLAGLVATAFGEAAGAARVFPCAVAALGFVDVLVAVAFTRFLLWVTDKTGSWGLRTSPSEHCELGRDSGSRLGFLLYPVCNPSLNQLTAPGTGKWARQPGDQLGPRL